jgi:hypothetical protein
MSLSLEKDDSTRENFSSPVLSSVKGHRISPSTGSVGKGTACHTTLQSMKEAMGTFKVVAFL